MRRAAQFATAVALATLEPSRVGAAPMAMQSRVGLLVDEAHRRAAEGWQQLQGAPDELGRIAGDWSAAWQSGEALRAITYVLILLLVGCGVEWLYWCYAGRARQAIAETAFAEAMSIYAKAGSAAMPPRRAAVLSLRRALLEAGGVGLFAVSTIAASAGFSWPVTVREAVLGVALTASAVRLTGIVGRALLAPGAPRLRLLPVDDQTARRVRADAAAIAGVVSGGASLHALGTSVLAAPALAFATNIAAAAAVCGLALDGIRLGSASRKTRRRDRLATAAAIMPFLTVAAAVGGFACVLFNAMQPAWSIAIVCLAVLVQRACSALIDAFALPAAEAGRPVAAYRPVLHRIATFAVIGLSLAALAGEWGLSSADLRRSPGALERVLAQALDITVVVLLADLAWLWAKSVIDRRLAAGPRRLEGAAGACADTSTRIQTLLPLLRKTILVIVIITAGLISLSALGINIAPLLAGAGVVGIAVGFGAQALVRDIVSGIFFLLEDSFRLGEYVEFGQIRGTVEGISLRFLRLRHHRGAVHTIPFGEIRWLTNQSRDWQIMKLEFRVPFDTDVRLVKTLVRRIGDELMQDAELGPWLIEPLKSRGVIRMEEFCMVIGVKFTARPGDGQFMVRREAYHRILDAFSVNGINFSHRHLKVEMLAHSAGETLPPNFARGAAEVPLELPIDLRGNGNDRSAPACEAGLRSG